MDITLTTLLKVEFKQKNKVYKNEKIILVNESMKKKYFGKETISNFL